MEDILNQLRYIIPKIKVNDGVETETLDLYDFIKGLWISKISTTIDKKLILNSNHFINNIIKTDDTGQEDGNYTIKRKKHKIYSRIINNYYNIVNNKSSILVIEDRCIFLHNSFSTGNAGHDLFCILNILYKYKDSNIKFVLFDEIQTNTNNYHIVKLFINDDRIIKIKSGHIYQFKRQIFHFENDFHYVSHYTNIINELIYKVKDVCCKIYDKKNLKKKVIIIKNNNQDFIVRKDDSFNSILLFDYLKENDWYICNPEKDNFFEMVYTLMNAQVIITGQQGISCCNQIFYNLHAKIIGFIKNEHDNILKLTEKKNIKLDVMCNDYYYDKMDKVIISPLNITQENVKQFKILFEYYCKIPDIYNVNVYYGTRNLYNGKECEKDLEGIKYGESINFVKAINSFIKTDDCDQLIYHIPSSRVYGMKVITILSSNKDFVINDFITITKNINK